MDTTEAGNSTLKWGHPHQKQKRYIKRRFKATYTHGNWQHQFTF